MARLRRVPALAEGFAESFYLGANWDGEWHSSEEFQDGSRYPNVHHIPSGARGGQPRVPLANCGADQRSVGHVGRYGTAELTWRPNGREERWAAAKCLSGLDPPVETGEPTFPGTFAFSEGPAGLPGSVHGWSVAPDFELKVDCES